MRFILYHKLIYITLMVGNIAWLLGLGRKEFFMEPKIGIPITLVFLTINIHNFIRIKKKALYQTLVLEEFLTVIRMLGPVLIISGYGIYIPLFLSPVSCTWWLPLMMLLSLPKDFFFLVFFIIPTILISIEYIYLTKLKILRNA